MTIKITGAKSVPDRKALAGAFADCNLTITIPMIEAISPMDVKAKGNIIISLEPKVYAIAIEAIIDPQ